LELESDESKAAPVRTAATNHLAWQLKVTNRANNAFGYARQTYKTQGTIKDGYFIPHDNESGYWWQGENARIGSLAAATVYAARFLHYSDSVKVFQYAADQLDWIMGKNPFDICFMYGKGRNNPEKYTGQALSLTLSGGIANGITGYSKDGSGIAWNDSRVYENSWDSWRWVEQWLPHTTWYTLALVTRYDETAYPLPKSSSPSGEGDDPPARTIPFTQSKDATLAGASFLQVGNSLQVEFSTSAERKFRIVDTRGRVLMNRVLGQAKNAINLATLPKGVYMVQVQGFAPKKIVVK
jgi:hypothetical protein